MRGAILLLALLLPGCGGEPAPEPADASSEAWPLDAFLHLLPERSQVEMRLPSAAYLAQHGEEAGALLRLLGHGGTTDATAFFLAVASPEGLDPATGPGYARDEAGNSVLCLPAADVASLNRSLQPVLDRYRRREEGRWVLLLEGTPDSTARTAEPLPPGDLVLRVRHHPLLTAFAGPGDRLEVALSLGGGGLEIEGRLRAAEDSGTSTRLGAAGECPGDLLDFLPGWLAVRVETSLPPSALSGLLTRRIARHGGIEADADRVLLERFLREALTGLDAGFGFAFGLEFREGDVSCVAYGRKAAGPDSPVLATLRKQWQNSFGALVLDGREATQGLLGWRAWLAEPLPDLERLPESAWSLVADLTSLEEGGGVPVAHAEVRDYEIVGIGRRADLLVEAVRERLQGGTARTPSSQQLREMRTRGEGTYLLGIALEGGGFEGLAPLDRAALRRWFGATDKAHAPQAVALAGFREGPDLVLLGRALY